MEPTGIITQQCLERYLLLLSFVVGVDAVAVADVDVVVVVVVVVERPSISLCR